MPKPIGQDIARHEGRAPTIGAACYLADVDPGPGLLHVAFLRSPVAAGHFTLGPSPDAAVVLTGADVTGLGAPTVAAPIPMDGAPEWTLLPETEISAIGQPLAAVAAGSPGAARAAVDALSLDVAPEPAPAPTRVAGQTWRAGDPGAAFAAAAQVVSVEVQHATLAPSPLEPRGILVRPEPDGGLTIWHSTQTPHRTRSELAAILGQEAEAIRVIAPDTGGAFGAKASLYPEEVLVVLAALRTGRPCRWIASRSEEFLSATHGRGLMTRARLALDGDGRFTALEARVVASLGHWMPTSALVPAWNAGRILPGPYDIPALDIRTEAFRTASPAFGIYRGAGRPEAAMLMERLVQAAAVATGRDAVALRRRNLLSAERLPHVTGTGSRLDSGDYRAALDMLPWDEATAWRDAARAEGRLAGIGVACFVEPSGEGWESARVTLFPDGTAEVASGSSSQGQGRATAYAQIAAVATGLPARSVTVTFGDTAHCPEGIGALASRATAIGGSAVLRAAEAAAAKRNTGAELPVTGQARYANEGQAWGHGAVLVCAEVDRETGVPRLDRMICVDDAGTRINPALAEGQILGGLAQGLGEALMEAVRFDESGQLLTGSLMDYAVPRATDMPPVDLHAMESPTDTNPLGAKGLGEAGTIAAPPGIVLALLDALAPLGVTDLQMPLTPAALWSAMEAAKE